MKKPGWTDEAIYQIQGQIELDKAELAEWTPEYADYRDEHRQRIRKLRASIRVLLACERAEVFERGETNLVVPSMSMKSESAIAREILKAKKLQEKGK